METNSTSNSNISRLSFFQKVQFNMKNEKKTKWGYKLSSLFFLLCIILLPLLTTFFLIKHEPYEITNNIPAFGIILFNLFSFFWFLFKKKRIDFFNFMSFICYFYYAYNFYISSYEIKATKYQLNIIYLYLIISMTLNLFIIKFNNPLLACIHDTKIRKEFLDTKLKIFIYISFPFLIYILFLSIKINILSLLTIIVCPELISNSFIYYYVKYIDQKSNKEEKYDRDVIRRRD